MLPTSGREGPDGMKPHCKTCEYGWSFCLYGELNQAARDGCPRCGFVAACIATVEEHFAEYGIASISADSDLHYVCLMTHRGKIHLNVFIKSRKTGNLHTPMEINNVHAGLPGATDTLRTQQTIRRWLHNCAMCHTNCQGIDEHNNEFRGPRRLLDVNNYSVVLRENMGKVRYACLSHCWGKNIDAITKTTEQNIERFKINISENELSENFKDAIQICRSLEVDYLWVDSLCIIQDQDSKEDWNEQATQMSEIYTNAYVTIAATRSVDASGGCYSRTHPTYLAKPVPGYKGVFVSLQPPALASDSTEYDRIGEDNQPLLERGWVYQELRLSPRVLHFCDNQVLWVCRTKRLSESNRNFDEVSSNYLHYTYMKHDLPSDNPRLLWYRWVHEYSRLQLSFPNKDRMAAIAGLAKHIQKYHKMGRYLSGLWESSLAVDLAWYTLSPPDAESEKDTTTDPAKDHSYPSWSWASVKAPIKWGVGMKGEFSSLARVTKIDYAADGPVYMGSALKSSHSITIEAPAIDGRDLYPPTPQKIDSSAITEINQFKWVAYIAAVMGDPEWTEKLHNIMHMPKSTTPTPVEGLNISGYYPDRKMKEPQAKLGGLILVVGSDEYGGGAKAIHVKLRTDQETYERVGLVSLDDEGYGGRDHDGKSAITKPWDALPLREITLT